ncbi:unnamed protein product [Protopolystoma xenopodis]|uniref:Uncharacterized protein n=1 Tax=Protopolystoma xenopodis TaxID=117903 RepID=A0A3S5AP48_9PLAT|nr:unnamed protein product [Protopolystoma xenopodis]
MQSVQSSDIPLRDKASISHPPATREAPYHPSRPATDAESVIHFAWGLGPNPARPRGLPSTPTNLPTSQFTFPVLPLVYLSIGPSFLPFIQAVYRLLDG